MQFHFKTVGETQLLSKNCRKNAGFVKNSQKNANFAKNNALKHWFCPRIVKNCKLQQNITEKMQILAKNSSMKIQRIIEKTQILF